MHPELMDKKTDEYICKYIYKYSVDKLIMNENKYQNIINALKKFKYEDIPLGPRPVLPVESRDRSVRARLGAMERVTF